MRSPSPTEDATRHSDPPTAIPAPFEGPLFLVGMPRSGTKLLRALLNRHPNISIMTNETEFLPYLVSHWESFGDLSDFAPPQNSLT